MGLDEADDIVVLLCRRLETALAVGGDDELVTVDASAVTGLPSLPRRTYDG